jgi:hypothetical protein
VFTLSAVFNRFSYLSMSALELKYKAKSQLDIPKKVLPSDTMVDQNKL